MVVVSSSIGSKCILIMTDGVGGDSAGDGGRGDSGSVGGGGCDSGSGGVCDYGSDGDG